MKTLAILLIGFIVNAHSSSSDDKNFNLALSSKNLKHSVLIKKKDKKIECFGFLKRNTGYCNMTYSTTPAKKYAKLIKK